MIFNLMGAGAEIWSNSGPSEQISYGNGNKPCSLLNWFTCECTCNKEGW